VFCTQCGQQNPADSRFCARCGHPLEQGGGSGDTTSTFSVSALEKALEAGEPDSAEAGHDGPTSLDNLPAGSALLVVKRGPNAGSRFLLDADSTTAGRHPDSDIFLDDITVSRRHAEFVREGGGFVVRDVGSLNGTYLNRERIERAVLAGGDEVQIGKYRLVFLTGPSAGEGS
jgi:pSer/pThr/pTyr-binding forkhead associated (FHA) protein